MLDTFLLLCDVTFFNPLVSCFLSVIIIIMIIINIVMCISVLFFLDGQSVAIRLNKHLVKNSKEMGKVHAALQDLGVEVTLAELMDTDHIVYQQVVQGISRPMQQAALAQASYMRACEADTQAKMDMRLLLEDFVAKGTALSAQIEETACKGTKHLLAVRLQLLVCMHADCVKRFSLYVPVEGVDRMPVHAGMNSLPPNLDEVLGITDADGLDLEEVDHISDLESDDVDSDVE